MTDVLSAARAAAPEGPMPPQAIEAERAVLAALLLDSENAGLAIERLKAEAFYRTSHQRIYDAVLAGRDADARVLAISLTLIAVVLIGAVQWLGRRPHAR